MTWQTQPVSPGGATVTHVTPYKCAVTSAADNAAAKLPRSLRKAFDKCESNGLQRAACPMADPAKSAGRPPSAGLMPGGISPALGRDD